MKGKIFILAMLMAVCLVRAGYTQEVPAVYEVGSNGVGYWYTMHEGTVSHRKVTPEGTVVISDSLFLGDYLGAPFGGKTTWNSGAYTYNNKTLGYDDFAIFWTGQLSRIDERSDVEKTHRTASNWRMNLRMAMPHAYRDNPTDPDKKYPLIIMMHGAGEGAYCRGDCLDNSNIQKYNNDHNIYHGGKEHLEAMSRDPDDPRHWPGFVAFPQSNQEWIPTIHPDNTLGLSVRFVKIMIDLILQGYPVDPYRIYIHGLSNGGRGSYLLLFEHPDLIAAAAPMSGSSGGGYASSEGVDENNVQYNYPPEESLVHVPIWQFQGETDTKPTPALTNYYLDIIRDAGGNVRYKQYPLKGHSIWYDAYDEPDFFSWFLQYSKLSIHSYFNVNRICPGVILRLGISPGFEAYEWEQSLDQGASWASYDSNKDPVKPNEILADGPGLYRVRVQRDAGNGTVEDEQLEWSPWSEPFELFHRDRPKPVISTNGSWVLWGLDNNTSLTLATDFTTAEEYTWYKNTNVYPAGADKSEITLNGSGAGTYTVDYVDDLCPSLLSEPVYINLAPTNGGEPATPTNFGGKSTSVSTTTLWWDDVGTEMGYEIYRSLDGGSSYVWLENTEENIVQFNDSQLPGGLTIYYKIRSFNENGASADATVEIAMPVDTIAPSIPQNFSFARFFIEDIQTNLGQTYSENAEIETYDEFFRIHLDQAVFTWSPVDDGSPVTYDIYNGQNNLVGSTQDTSFVVPGLEENQTYDFYVKTRDINNLESGRSQTGTVFTAFNGLYYKFYQGALWGRLADYSFHPQSGEGRIHNFLIDDIPEYSNVTDYFAYDFIGYINIDEAGEYEFATRSDDGSSLWIGDSIVVNNDDQHAPRTKTGLFNFDSPGIYPITVKFFERVGGNVLEVTWKKPGDAGFSSIPNNVLTTSDVPPAQLPDAPTNLVATADQYSADLTWDHVKESVKVVVLGSSTAAGVGASSTAASWVGKFTTALTDQNPANSLHNLAQGGFTSYHILPTGTVAPGKPKEDPLRNISAALDLNPDIIIVNLPSNDRANGYDLTSETLENLLTIQATATAANVEIYFTTTQPRTEFNQTNRDLLAEEAKYILQFFGTYAINIYDELADANGAIKTQYRYSADDIHLNDAGHNYLFTRIWSKVNAQSIPVFEVFRMQEGGSYELGVTTGKQVTFTDDPDLLPGTRYDYKVRAVTSAGASPFSNVAFIVTAGDTEDPTIPQNFRATSVSDTKITLVWDASTDNVGVVKYVIVDVTSTTPAGKLQEEIMGETPLTSITLEGLTPMETYKMVVYAEDYAGNKSAYSNEISVSMQNPLPVEFLNVSHRITEDGVLIQWATASELNNAFFTVERGTGIDDFVPIGGVDGAGTTNSRRDYALLDTNPMDLAYYRVKQTDFDGAFEYSKIIRVVYDEENLPEFTVYPNPTTQENIQARGYVPSDKAMVLVKLLDVMGKIHMVKELDPNQFMNGVRIDLNYPVPPGVYIILISDGVNNTQRRVVIR